MKKIATPIAGDVFISNILDLISEKQCDRKKWDVS
jgi:hypothetical protein